jgi:hypothetical protein
MLNAIGIYLDCRETKPGVFQKVNAAPQHKGGLFSSNPLANLEKHSLTQLPPILELNSLYSFHVNAEFHYILKTGKFLLTIASRKELFPKELAFLFKNIEHVQLRPATVKVTLDDIVANPLGFIGKDILVGKVLQDVQELKVIALNDMDKMLDRGQKLEELYPRTIKLQDESLKFKEQAEKLNKCCWW